MLYQSIYVLGGLTSAYYATQFLRFLHLHIRSSSLLNYRRSANTWALVTGASDGIGLAFVKELAHKGFNVVLHGRNPDKLEKLKKKLSDEFPDAQFRTLVLDASIELSEKQIIDTIESLQTLQLTVLINNVGGTAGIMDPSTATLSKHSRQGISKVVNVNATFPTQLTRALWPLLTTNSPSLIMNISSAASAGYPYCSVYSGCKAFIKALTHSLFVEAATEGEDIEVLGIVVGKVTAVSHCSEQVSLSVPSAETMAKAALQKVGCGRAITTGYWAHALQVWAIGLLPEWMFVRFLGSTIKAYAKERAKERKVS